jgi:hypothetical protein
MRSSISLIDHQQLLEINFILNENKISLFKVIFQKNVKGWKVYGI